jgi:hypothetical protein
LGRRRSIPRDGCCRRIRLRRPGPILVHGGTDRTESKYNQRRGDNFRRHIFVFDRHRRLAPIVQHRLIPLLVAPAKRTLAFYGCRANQGKTGAKKAKYGRGFRIADIIILVQMNVLLASCSVCFLWMTYADGKVWGEVPGQRQPTGAQN